MGGAAAGASFLCALVLGILLHHWLEQQDAER